MDLDASPGQVDCKSGTLCTLLWTTELCNRDLVDLVQAALGRESRDPMRCDGGKSYWSDLGPIVQGWTANDRFHSFTPEAESIETSVV